MTDTQALIERPYLIRKQGAWYRPNCSGYTISAIQAGRYSLDEAERYTHPNGKDGPRDGMHYVHEDDVGEDVWKAFRTLTTALTEANTKLVKAGEDAARYHWLRDHSCPPHNFYISVPDEFYGVRYSSADVDIYIDEARACLAELGEG